MHVFRPLWVFLGLLAVILVIRPFAVPDGFGVHEQGYMYGWYDKQNELCWKNFSIKYRDKEICKSCHPTQNTKIATSPHRNMQCENCHGPAVDHPITPAKLAIDRTRGLCLRCHSILPYPQSDRSKIRGINPKQHNHNEMCVSCHDPHTPSLEKL
jgi:hypothetical protein